MPKAYSNDLRERAVIMYRSGVPALEISETLLLDVKNIYRWDELERKTGSYSPQYKAGGRDTITDDEAFIEFAEAHAHCTLQQMADHWNGEVSIYAISRKLRKLGITRKKRHSATANAAKKSAKNS